jgi:hypothetical protein
MAVTPLPFFHNFQLARKLCDSSTLYSGKNGADSTYRGLLCYARKDASPDFS